MLIVTCKFLMLSIFILDVVMLSVVAPYRWQKKVFRQRKQN